VHGVEAVRATKKVGRCLAGAADTAQLAARLDTVNAESARASETLRTTQEELTRLNTHTWCYMIGGAVPGAANMDKMFGHKRWKEINASSITEDSFDFIRAQFTQYLKR